MAHPEAITTHRFLDFRNREFLAPALANVPWDSGFGWRTGTLAAELILPTQFHSQLAARLHFRNWSRRVYDL
jgi:hypothetical protein